MLRGGARAPVTGTGAGHDLCPGRGRDGAGLRGAGDPDLDHDPPSDGADQGRGLHDDDQGQGHPTDGEVQGHPVVAGPNAGAVRLLGGRSIGKKKNDVQTKAGAANILQKRRYRRDRHGLNAIHTRSGSSFNRVCVRASVGEQARLLSLETVNHPETVHRRVLRGLTSGSAAIIRIVFIMDPGKARPYATGRNLGRWKKGGLTVVLTSARPGDIRSRDAGGQACCGASSCEDVSVPVAWTQIPPGNHAGPCITEETPCLHS
ncbi:hypothetical protein Bbelb_093250 [Branchiostoma belcheri]|nr:hypothetical protein Bbelb_093250 [Branchiostoma belcheri]